MCLIFCHVLRFSIINIKLRYACGKIDEDAYTVAIQEYSNRKDVLQLELDKWQINLSNQSAKIPVVIATASKIGTLWKQSNLENKKKIQNLVFPDGIFWDKKIRNYRTKKRNAMFELLDRISATYGNKKEPPLSEAVPLCGQWDNYRTFFEDFEKVYLLGIQLIVVLKNF